MSKAAARRDARVGTFFAARARTGAAEDVGWRIKPQAVAGPPERPWASSRGVPGTLD